MQNQNRGYAGVVKIGWLLVVLAGLTTISLACDSGGIRSATRIMAYFQPSA